jgi:predicted transcriptional regulator of viral defense system
MKNHRAQAAQRFAQLASRGEIIFHTNDLARLWGIQGNNLHTTLKRYAQQKLIYRVWRGMYAIKPPGQLDPLLLGIKALHIYGYISCETILARSGIISQQPQAITLVSSVSRRFSVAGHFYYSRKLSDIFLYNPAGVKDGNGIKQALPERAVADILYFNPKAHLDSPNLADWKKVRQIQKILGYPGMKR